MQSWIESANQDPDFTIYNIPFGLFSSPNDSTKRAATRLGDKVIDLKAISQQGLLGKEENVKAALESVIRAVS